MRKRCPKLTYVADFAEFEVGALQMAAGKWPLDFGPGWKLIISDESGLFRMLKRRII